jgi:nicotinate-nucleotide adenylyltransferase
MAGLTELVGIYGGTFDPPHNGHLILAEVARTQIKLDRVVWVLTRQSPHKQDRSISPVNIRLKLLQLALGESAYDDISRVEIDRSPPYYALDTICLLQASYPAADLVYLMGGDSLRDLPTWHKPVQFIKSCFAIGVLNRPGIEMDLSYLEHKLPGIKDKVIWIQSPMVDISASMIRQRIRQNLPYREYLPKAVADYIDQNDLYHR